MCGVRLAVACILAVYAVSAFPDSSKGYEPEQFPSEISPSPAAASDQPEADSRYPPFSPTEDVPYSAKPYPPSWGFKCPHVGNFADPYSKNFISCVETNSGSFEAIPRDCPGNLCYNAPIDACDWPYNVNTLQCRKSESW